MIDLKGKNTDVLNCVLEFHSLLMGLQIMSYPFARDIRLNIENIVNSPQNTPDLSLRICVINVTISFNFYSITLSYYSCLGKLIYFYNIIDN